MVKLRGLEPVTFSLRRHRVELTTREHRVTDVHAAAAGAAFVAAPRHAWGAHGYGRSFPCVD